MKLSVTGRQVDIGESFQMYVDDQFKNLLERYNVDPVDTAIVISKEGHLFRCDISSKIGRVNIRAQESGIDVYHSFDDAFHTLAGRLRRHKRRLMDHHKHHDTHAQDEKASYYVLNGAIPETDYEDDEDLAPAIIAELQTDIATLSLEDAVMRLDLSDAPTFVFRNSKHGVINIVYRRVDGNIGWIDPSK